MPARGQFTASLVRHCGRCGRSFRVEMNQAARGRGIYCSRGCSSAAVGDKLAERYARATARRVSVPFEDGGVLACSVDLGNGATALIDAADAPKAGRLRWRLMPHGYARAEARSGEGRAMVYLHRLVLDAPAGAEVDHLNGDRLDCRRVNLRLVTREENQHNIWAPNRNSRTGVRGVTWLPNRRRFKAEIMVYGRRIVLGHFRTLDDAAKAAVAGRLQHTTAQLPAGAVT